MSDGCQNRDRGQEPFKPSRIVSVAEQKNESSAEKMSRQTHEAMRLLEIKFPKTKTDYREGFNPTIYLFQKWAFKVERGWYGFNLEGVPFDWANKIDEFLTWTNDHIPEFKIHQIKLKFGGIRIYLDLGLPDNLIQDNILSEYIQRKEKLEKECFDKELIY